ncbi:hypothetical protein ACNKU7_01830 [Microbulbifer sp. SA54]|uniref:hypothetical protein n=1 Tax=Microbulbifer sp. SA54 TaxID=3401577 RepID=UPI003AAC4149
MESYVNLSLTSQDHAREFKQAMECLSNFDLDGCRDALKFLPSSALKDFGALHEMYPEYLEYLEGLEILDAESASVSATFVCGSDGLDFLFQMFVLFGPFVEAISANYEHDEEYDESEFSSIVHQDGKLFINGNEVYDQQGHDKDVFEYLSEEVLGMVSQDSGCSLLITSTPSGFAPDWVREQWIGMKLPLTAGALNGDLEIDEIPPEVDASSGKSIHYNSPIVLALDAFELLKEKSPEAWEWWHNNCPDLFASEAALVFNEGSWEVVSD